MNSLPLWKRCRVLASEERLSALVLLEERGAECVKGVAEALNVSESIASRQLQLMYLAGCLVYERRGKFLFYSTTGDPLTRSVLGALKLDDFHEIMFLLTAFTHERRSRVMKCLESGARSLELLSRDSEMPLISLKRQLDKLTRRGLVKVEDRICSAVKPTTRFGRELVELARMEYTFSKV